jgi:hypothetical protein
MIRQFSISRRGFVLGSMAGGLALGLHLPALAADQ